jgi:hypothetical protein
VQVIQPISEATVLTPALAAILNQTLAENFSNNLRKAIEAGVPADETNGVAARDFTDDEVQALADKYMAEYEPGVRRTGDAAPRVTDPVEREARKLAKAKVAEILKARNLKPKDVGTEGVADLVDKLFTKNRDAFMAAGKKVVAALEKAAAAGTDSLDLDLGLGEPADAAA